MLPLTVTPEFQAVLAADLESLRARLAAATGTLLEQPADQEAQAALASALHSLKGLAGMAGARPLGGTVSALEPVFEHGVRLAGEGDEPGAREAFAFCRGPEGEMDLLITETIAGRGSVDPTAEVAGRLRAALTARWPEGRLLPRIRRPATPVAVAPPPPLPDSPADADVLAFLEELGVSGSTGPVRPPAPPPPEVRATLPDPLARMTVTPPGKVEEGSPASAPPPAAVGPAEASGEGGGPGEAVDAEMLQYFIPETLEYCEAIEHALADLERGDAPAEEAESPRRVFLRMWHTIKGAANSIGLVTIGRMAHAVEGAWDEHSALPPEGQLAVAAMATDILRDYLRECAAAPAGTAPAPPQVSVNILLAHLAEGPCQVRAEENAREEVPPAPGVEAACPEPIAPTPEPADPPAAPGRRPEHAPAATFEAPGARVDPATLDRLMDLVGELTVSRNRLLAKVATFTGLQGELEACKNRLQRIVGDFQGRHEYSMPGSTLPLVPSPSSTARPAGFGALEFDEYDDLNLLSRALAEVGADTAELIDGSRRCFGDFAAESDRFRKVSTELQETLTGVRMVPLTALFRRLRRVAAEAAGKEAKEIDWQTEGEGTRLDRVIVEEVFVPLLHLVRNAVGHGVEAPAAREFAGKPRAGRVFLRASQRGGHALIELTDDGRGLNFHAIRARGLAAGLIDAETADEWDDERLVALLFRPGFSTRTAAECNDVGGRGVGLDVVLQQVTRLGGTVEVESHAETGCTWRLKLPVTLTIGQAMFVEVGGQTFALPLTFVERLAFCGPGTVARHPDGSEHLTVDGLGSLPLLRLEELLGLSGQPAPESPTSLAVVARVADKRLAFPVAGLGRRAEIVTKPLPTLLADHPFFSGATIDSDGRAVLILDVPRLASGFFARGGLFALVSSRTRPPTATFTPPAAAGTTRERLLVVDDSLSVRKVAEKLARELGYDVETAVDGQAALEKLDAAPENQPFAAVLTDLEMPRLDGFGLIAEIRGRAAWRELPVIVVTSRQAEKHRQRAAELGATDYLVKPFTKVQLAEKLDAARGAVAT